MNLLKHYQVVNRLEKAKGVSKGHPAIPSSLEIESCLSLSSHDLPQKVGEEE